MFQPFTWEYRFLLIASFFLNVKTHSNLQSIDMCYNNKLTFPVYFMIENKQSESNIESDQIQWTRLIEDGKSEGCMTREENVIIM